MLITREELEENEAKVLASYAVKSSDSLGRKEMEENDKYRLCFQKDKERVIHSKAFRRLDEKTQVFTAGSGDHYRTRLTHTLEVAQIAKSIARQLGLNEDLAEVIALAHDLGHPPFGHSGEEMLNKKMEAYGSHFEHNEQSRRIVEKLEKSYPNFDGLNLSLEVIDGLIKHQTAFDQASKKFEVSAHLEAQVVNLADEIAYINHDIDDGLRSGLITLDELNDFRLWKIATASVEEKYGTGLDSNVFVSRAVSSLISLMIEDICVQSEKNIQEYNIESVEDVRKLKNAIVHFTLEMRGMVNELRGFLYKNFYFNPKVVEFVNKGKMMISELFEFYIKNPDKVPQKQYLEHEDDAVVAVKDYIAGMTDGFLAQEHKTYIMRA